LTLDDLLARMAALARLAVGRIADID